MRQYLFIGERPSMTAFSKGWTWSDGRLAGRTLCEALDRLDIPEKNRSFLNLFGDTPEAPMSGGAGMDARLSVIRKRSRSAIVVGMGQKVCRVLAEHGIRHIAIVHPAARGKIRAKETYIAHIAHSLSA